MAPSGDSENESFDVEGLPEPCREAIARIKTHETRPGRQVFVEDGNSDGWIATDLTVDLVG